MENQIIDAHVHLITAGMINDARERGNALYPEFSDALASHFLKRFAGKTPDEVFGGTIKSRAEAWLKAMDENGISKAVFLPISERLDEIAEFVKIAPDRFIGYAFLNNPTAKSAPQALRKAVKELGLKGLKLYPPIQMFNPADKAMFPLYEEARSLGIPITFHFGITLAPLSDYRFANPIDLQLPLRLFPELNFIIAHFGAGFFREACLLAFHNKNISLDTSGTNNWRDYTPERLPLEEIFKRAVEIYSAERIIFGTDTVMNALSGYRSAIKAEQEAIVNSLKISAEEKKLILGGNAARLY
ncbi:MAG: amidohydrolase [Nitrospinae bacterium]|nr:amidohydrolase [Nitrospinota bacterium]